MIQLTKKSNKELLALWSDIMKELRRRKLLRTSNSPVADYAEYLVSKKLRLKLSPNSNKSFDAYDKNGIKYQIKSRRFTSLRHSTQLGVIRDLKSAKFNYLITVFFNEDFSVNKIYKVPRNIIRKYSRYSKHQNGHILHMRGNVLDDKNVKIII